MNELNPMKFDDCLHFPDNVRSRIMTLNPSSPLCYGEAFKPMMFSPVMVLPPSLLIEVQKLANQAGQDVSTTIAELSTAMRAFHDVAYTDFAPSISDLRKALQAIEKQGKPKKKNALGFLDGLGYSKHKRK